jgi:MerR family redox-sensitive transcriptional activator SoxR
MKPLSIGELSRRTAAPASAIRYYESVGVLPKPARVSGRRLYDEDAIARVNVLRFAQQAGFSLKDIRALFGSFGTNTSMGARWRTLAVRKLQELDLMSQRIEGMKRAIELGMKCGCVRIEDCNLTARDAVDPKPKEMQRGCGRAC